MKNVALRFVGILAIGALAACGSSDDDSTDTTGTTTDTGTTDTGTDDDHDHDDHDDDHTDDDHTDDDHTDDDHTDDDHTDDDHTDDDHTDAVEVVVPTAYQFESKFEANAGESSVSYTGQVARHVLIAELTDYIGGLTDKIDNGDVTPAAGETLENLNFFWNFDSDATPEYEFGLSTGDDTPVLQANLDAISTGKKPGSKMAGEDYDQFELVTSGDGSATLIDFTGWNLAINADGTVPATPTELMQAFFGLIDGLAADRANGTTLTGPAGNPVEAVYLNDAGHDLKQLVQKFALGGVTISQGLGDYLANITSADNVEPYKGTKNHTAMEHKWDEGFGYFGAARNYGDYTDDEIAKKGGRDDFQGFNDADGDGFIDLAAEYNFGNSVNAAKRDRGGSTDFTADAFSAWTRGRALIHAHVGMNYADWSAESQADLVDQIVAIQAAWEGAVAATVVHYINDTLGDMAKFGTDEYSYATHAKHWGELKGFALGLQFNPWSPLHAVLPEYCYDMTTHVSTEGVSEADCTASGGLHTPESTGFVRLHNKIGDAPVLPNNPGGTAAIMGYQGSLATAKNIMKDAYGFDADDVANW